MVWKRQQNAYGKTPVATTPYQKAAQVWDERIGSARVQAKNWRIATLASLGVSTVLAGGMLWQATQSLVTPYVVEIDTTGEVRGVTPTVQGYVPSDAQIAFQLADFIRKTRGISSDPVVLRQNSTHRHVGGLFCVVRDQNAVLCSDDCDGDFPHVSASHLSIGQEGCFGSRGQQSLHSGREQYGSRLERHLSTGLAADHREYSLADRTRDGFLDRG